MCSTRSKVDSLLAKFCASSRRGQSRARFPHGSAVLAKDALIQVDRPEQRASRTRRNFSERAAILARLSNAGRS